MDGAFTNTATASDINGYQKTDGIINFFSYADNDQDGIPNKDDLDDDNDGILDTAKSCSTPANSTTDLVYPGVGEFAIINTPITAPTLVGSGLDMTATYSNAIDYLGTLYDVRFTVTDDPTGGSGNTFVWSTTTLLVNHSGSGGVGDWFGYKLEFLQAGTTTPATIDFGLYMVDLDANGGVQFANSEIVATHTANPTNLAESVNGIYLQYQGTVNGSSDPVSSVIGIYNDVYEINIKVKKEFDNSGYFFRDYTSMPVVLPCELDTDGDGIADHLDTDSDGDGCADAVEAAGSYTNADLATDGSLDYANLSPSGVGANGVINAGSQANDGDVTDESTQSSSCNECTSPLLIDTDGDGIVNICDQDDDNDGIPDYLESVCSGCPTFGFPTGSDSDGDGVLYIYEGLTSANATGGTNTGATPNEDDDDGANPPDYLDTDSDNDGAYDWSEGFDSNGNGQAADDLIALAATYETNNSSPGHYPTTDTDSDGLPDWLDNQPNTSGYDEMTRPPFLDPLSSYWHDSNNNGLADIFDPETNGTIAPTPKKDGGNDNDWRDVTYVAALPVELSSFEGKVVDCSIRLDWVAESEENFRGYILERSTDGILFEAITSINSNGDGGKQHYSYLDKSSSPRNYYRLKMEDLDGSFEYSDLIIISMPCNQSEREMQVYPNLVKNNQNLLNVKFFSSQSESSIVISDVLGKLVRVINVSSEAGWNTMRLDITGLPSGAYFIGIQQDPVRPSMVKFIITE